MNSFLGSNTNISDIATETTLKKLEQDVNTGITVNQSGTLDINISEINTNPIAAGQGIAGPDVIRMCICSDNQALEVKTGVSPFNVGANITALNGNTIDLGSGATALGTQRIVIANDQSAVDTNLDRVDGNVVEIGNGVANTGCQRICIASDNTPYNVITQLSTNRTYIHAFLKNGGSSDMNVDASITQTDFTYGSIADDTYITRLIVLIEDNAAIDIDKFGGLTALTTGVDILDKGSSLLDGILIKSNADWLSICYDGTIYNTAGGDDAFTARWTFTKGNQIGLKLDNGEIFTARLNDDLSGLVKFRMALQGYTLT